MLKNKEMNEDVVRYNVDLPLEIYSELRKEAFEREIFMAEIIREELSERYGKK